MKSLLRLAFVLLPWFAVAQEPLSLEMAIQRGLKNNFDIQIQNSLVDIAKNNNNSGQAGRFPNEITVTVK